MLIDPAAGSQTRGLDEPLVELSKMRILPFGSRFVWIGTIGKLLGVTPPPEHRRIRTPVCDGQP